MTNKTPELNTSWGSLRCLILIKRHVPVLALWSLCHATIYGEGPFWHVLTQTSLAWLTKKKQEREGILLITKCSLQTVNLVPEVEFNTRISQQSRQKSLDVDFGFEYQYSGPYGRPCHFPVSKIASEYAFFKGRRELSRLCQCYCPLHGNRLSFSILLRKKRKNNRRWKWKWSGEQLRRALPCLHSQVPQCSRQDDNEHT